MSNADDRVTARHTLIVIGLVLATAFALAFVYATRRVLVWVVVAAFFAVALKPLVDRLQRRLVRRRALATLLVFLAAFVLVALLGTLILVPLFGELGRFADRAPELLHDARAGRGPLGQLLERTGARRYVSEHSDQLRDLGTRLRQPAVGVLRGVVETVAGLVTVVVLAYLMVLEAPRITRRLLAAAGDGQGDRLRRVGREVSRTVTGYLTGNLLISVICGLLTYAVLALTGVPFAAVIALLVAVTDLIPLVGATIGRGDRGRGRLPALPHGRDRRAGLLRGLPAGGEPPAPTAHPVPGGPAQPADRAGQRAARRGAGRAARRAAGHPRRRHRADAAARVRATPTSARPTGRSGNAVTPTGRSRPAGLTGRVVRASAGPRRDLG